MAKFASETLRAKNAAKPAVVLQINDGKIVYVETVAP
jgi:hypothetical protein